MRSSPIPLVDVKAQYERLIPQIQQRIGEVLESGTFILGPNVKAFEAEAAELLSRLGLERLHVRAKDEDARVEHARDPLLDLRYQPLVLGPDVDEWDVRHGA